MCPTDSRPPSPQGPRHARGPATAVDGDNTHAGAAQARPQGSRTALHWRVSASFGLLCWLLCALAAADEVVRAEPAIATLKWSDRPLLQRDESTAMALLHDGRVLIIGGKAYGTSNSARRSEIVDPATLQFAAAGSLQYERRHAAVLTLSDGRVVVAGGAYAEFSLNLADRALAAAPEIWNPATAAWAPLDGIEIAADEAVLMDERDGTVVFVIIDAPPIVDGEAPRPLRIRALRWHLVDDRIEALPVPLRPREGGSLVTLLGNGRLLVAGGHRPWWMDTPVSCPACDAAASANPAHPPLLAAAIRCVDDVAALPGRIAMLAPVACVPMPTPACPPEGPRPELETAAADCGPPAEPERAIATSEVWDLRTGGVIETPAAPATLLGNVYGGISYPLHGGDRLVLTQQRPGGDEPLAPARFTSARWSRATGAWNLLPGFETSLFSLDLIETADGRLLRLDNRLDPGEPAWTPQPLPLPSTSARLLSIARNKIIALSTQAPFVAEYRHDSQGWEWLTRTYTDSDRVTSLGLPDGRLAVWGTLPTEQGQAIYRQLWQPTSDRWEVVRETLPAAAQKLDAALLANGDVLLLAHYEGDLAICQRWTPATDQRQDCGRLYYRESQPGNASGGYTPSAWSRVVLGSSTDGHLLLVHATDRAQVFDATSNRWQAVTLQATGELLLEGAPVTLRAPLFHYVDPATGAKGDASPAVLRYLKGRYGGYQVDALWDARRQHWAYVHAGTPQMGEQAAWLPDGCAIGVVDGHFQLFDPQRGKVSRLEPTPIDNAHLAVLADGTVTLVGEASAMPGRDPLFFQRRASCADFAGGLPVPAPAPAGAPDAQPVVAAPANSADRGSGRSLVAFRDHLAGSIAWLREHPGPLIFVLVVALLGWLQRRSLHSLRQRDRVIRVPAPAAIGLRVVFYGLAIMLALPLLLRLWSLHDEHGPTPAPSVERPCRYTGYWWASDPALPDGPRWRYYLGDDGELEAWRLAGNTAVQSVLRGRWQQQGEEMIWDDQTGDPTVLRILADVGKANGLLLEHPDGRRLQLRHAAPAFSQQACSA